MKEIFEEFETILKEENKILDMVSEKQKELRAAVTEKKWEKLLSVNSDINMLSDSFQHFDFRRDEIQKSLKVNELKDYFDVLSQLHSKLLKCKAENQALGSFVNVSKAFIQQIIENALPKARNKNYSRTGQIVQTLPQSVVVNQLF